jgi:hypothetical protein
MNTTHPDRDYAEARIRALRMSIEVTRQEDDYGHEVFIATRGPLTKPFPALALFMEWLGKVESWG